MLAALVLDAQGRRTDALMSLGQAFEEAPEPGGYARLFLDEGVTPAMLIGSVVILIGTALATGVLPRQRTQPAASVPASTRTVR